MVGWLAGTLIVAAMAPLVPIPSTNSTNSTQTKNDKQNDELLSLKDKAGNAGAFEVSQNYKSKCSSCHGVNGSGFQNGKPMMGPKIIGQSEDVIYQDLLDFKAGRKENVVMKGLLLKIEEPELRELAKEIATFASKLEKLNQK